MSEQSQRRRVIELLRPQHAVAVENPACPGTPDVAYTEGWIELKQLDRWPRNADSSPVLVEHYTRQQRIWAMQRRIAGGRCHLLMQVGREWLLFDSAVALYTVGLANRPTLMASAQGSWSEFNAGELSKCILQPQNNYWSSDDGRAELKRKLLAALISLSESM